MERPRVLVVAGYDPSGGAGVLADVKTLEAHAVYGYAVCTAMTFQNERVIRRVDWLPETSVFEQIDVCFDAAGFDWVKMGITDSTEAAGSIIRHLKQHNPSVRVVWDPVIRASSGTDFWRKTAGWEEVAAQCYLMTPNWEEMGWLYADGDVLERCRMLTTQSGCRVFLKGGHHPEHPGRDYLFAGGAVQVLEPVGGLAVHPKHGSGCVLASALTANLALERPLSEAAAKAKEYVERFLSSNKSLLGWHQ
ncbi:hydroxymethylpyrimidine/phosphomethylpyrimidine kinase [Puia dinghuensis]|uniref:hydroxymethylpyrimidine kinase n=1 Tax=Puia dinghuensis TaxID=1792502 RepID=A0A8J2UH31_9BACT|nr:hydroxymethylpyrimidine/phosphomethylpyrimidine kinase [Puia dinghuensis]GGB16794.1 hydroxymethylpyrimidine/phosphomethylpyrimidine kinase [Puia dinghuensis]